MKKYTKNEKTAVILGAGFSRSLGVPDYSKVIETIASPLDKNEYNLSKEQQKIDVEITKHIREFLENVFDCDFINGRAIPSLEQVFTFVDLSINSDHNLGKHYYATKLKGLRRFLIYKLFLIIDKTYEPKSFLCDLLNFCSASDFVTLNWDITLENRLLEMGVSFQYGIDEVAVNNSGNELEIVVRENNVAQKHFRKIAKIHGSSNWAYCYNCRKIFFMNYEKMSKTIHSGIYVEDIKRFYAPGTTDDEPIISLKKLIRKSAPNKKCPCCKSPLDSHIATFSYSKNFSTHAFDTSWKIARDILTDADRWLFIGYSLPEADYVFLHLLKCIQKQTDSGKKIIAVLKDDIQAQKKYELLFGKDNVDIHNDGIEDFTLNCI